MSILVLEGARRDAQWAIAHDGKVIGGRIRDRGAAEHLASAVQSGLEQAGLRATDLRHIIVGIGPGSYAGLRIVLAFAKGMAHALGASIVAVPSMEAMLRDAPALQGQRRVAIMNAFAGQVFAHGRDANDAVWLPTDAYLPAALNTALDKTVIGIVDGDLPMRAQIALETMIDVASIAGSDVPHGVLAIGKEKIARNEFADVMTLLPEYGRLSSAELKANLG